MASVWGGSNSIADACAALETPRFGGSGGICPADPSEWCESSEWSDGEDEREAAPPPVGKADSPGSGGNGGIINTEGCAEAAPAPPLPVPWLGLCSDV